MRSLLEMRSLSGRMFEMRTNFDLAVRFLLFYTYL